VQEVGKLDLCASLLQDVALRELDGFEMPPQQVVLVIWDGQQNRVVNHLARRIKTQRSLMPSCASVFHPTPLPAAWLRTHGFSRVRVRYLPRKNLPVRQRTES